MKQTDAEIRHAGRVVSVSGSQIKVQILTQTACSGCQAKAVCGASDGKTRIIPVRRPAGLQGSFDSLSDSAVHFIGFIINFAYVF